MQIFIEPLTGKTITLDVEVYEPDTSSEDGDERDELP